MCRTAFDASPEDFLNVLFSFSDDDCVLCVGHEPHLGHTAGTMLLGQPVSGLSFKKAGACCIRFHGKPDTETACYYGGWNRLNSGNWRKLMATLAPGLGRWDVNHSAAFVENLGST